MLMHGVKLSSALGGGHERAILFGQAPIVSPANMLAILEGAQPWPRRRVRTT